MKLILMLILSLFSFSTFSKVNIIVSGVKKEINRFIVPGKLTKKNSLDLGSDPKTLEIVDKGIFRISIKVEYSVTIMDEGPHLDLTEWKHSFTKWIPLKLVKQKFIIPTDIKEPPFPEISLEELVKGVDKFGGSRWSDVAKRCKSVLEYPCSIAPSRLQYKIEQQIDEKWQTVGTLSLIPAMGC